MRNYGGVDDYTLKAVKEIAGEGTIDERCSNILRVFAPMWFGETDD